MENKKLKVISNQYPLNKFFFLILLNEILLHQNKMRVLPLQLHPIVDNVFLKKIIKEKKRNKKIKSN